VPFLDEMDAIAKLRDDRHELGELKRIVNTVLQGLDSLADEVIAIRATNHPHLLGPLSGGASLTRPNCLFPTLWCARRCGSISSTRTATTGAPAPCSRASRAR